MLEETAIRFSATAPATIYKICGNSMHPQKMLISKLGCDV